MREQIRLILPHKIQKESYLNLSLFEVIVNRDENKKILPVRGLRGTACKGQTTPVEELPGRGFKFLL